MGVYRYINLFILAKKNVFDMWTKSISLQNYPRFSNKSLLPSSDHTSTAHMTQKRLKQRDLKL